MTRRPVGRPVPGLALLALLVLAAAPGCRTVISPYSHTAYLQATSLKARSLRLMDRASSSATESSRDLESIRTDLDAAHEYARGRPKNGFSTAQWERLLDSNGHLLGGFFTRWEMEGPLGATFIVEAKRLVSDAFDTISGLESGKVGAPPTE